MISPFGVLPLKTSPFYSRLYDNLQTNDVNYTMIAFNPGYALQASELNELQELFFLNLNLTQRMNSTWMSSVTTEPGGYRPPFWEGAIPLNPNYIEVINSTWNGTSLNVNVSISDGWYLITDTASKMSFWVTNTTDYINETIQGTGFSTYYIGFEGSFDQIDCCPNDTCEENQSEDLRDNSQGFTNTWNTCGGSRFKLTLENIDISGSLPSNFYPIIKITIDDGNPVATFMDGQSLVVQE